MAPKATGMTRMLQTAIGLTYSPLPTPTSTLGKVSRRKRVNDAPAASYHTGSSVVPSFTILCLFNVPNYKAASWPSSTPPRTCHVT